HKATEKLRKYALIWAGPLIITAAGIMIELRVHNPEHFIHMMDLGWMFALSVLFFSGTLWCLWNRRHYGFGFSLLIGQFGLAFFAYGISHLPYLMYPFLTIYDSFTNEAMAYSLVIAFIAGLCLLLPSLWLLMRLFLFDKSYVKGNN